MKILCLNYSLDENIITNFVDNCILIARKDMMRGAADLGSAWLCKQAFTSG